MCVYIYIERICVKKRRKKQKHNGKRKYISPDLISQSSIDSFFILGQHVPSIPRPPPPRFLCSLCFCSHTEVTSLKHILTMPPSCPTFFTDSPFSSRLSSSLCGANNKTGPLLCAPA